MDKNTNRTFVRLGVTAYCRASAKGLLSAPGLGLNGLHHLTDDVRCRGDLMFR